MARRETSGITNKWERYYPLILCLVAIVIYLPSITFQLTRLDDVVFVYKFEHYYSQYSNLLTSFRRGIFATTGDYFYRPVFMDVMLLQHKLFGRHLMGYHIVNILLHSGSVILLYQLLQKLAVNATHAFVLSLLYAVHPVLVQAVVWIPGSNDTLLSVWVLSFFISSINYAQRGKLKYLLGLVIFYLLALFTKETAVFAPLAAWLLLVVYQRFNWKSATMIRQYASWGIGLITWLFMHSIAHLRSLPSSQVYFLKVFVLRLPILLQYIGKVVFPFKLSVYPNQKDMVLLPGLAAIVILTALLLLSGKKALRAALCGLAIFLLFLMPCLLAPPTLGLQAFEHRLYLPMMGLLIMLHSTILFQKRIKNSLSALTVICLASFYIGLNFYHQQHFSNSKVFWSQAVASSPSSGFARMMLALQESDRATVHRLFQEAKAIDSDLPHLNFNIGIKLQSEDSMLASEPYLLAEQKRSNYFECDFYLARATLERRDFEAATTHFLQFVARDPTATQQEVERITGDSRWREPSARDLLIKEVLAGGIYNYRQYFRIKR